MGDGNNRRRAFGGIPAAVLASFLPAIVSASPQDGVTGDVRGFVMPYLWYAMANGPDECPDGFATLIDSYYYYQPLYNAGRTEKTADPLRYRLQPKGFDANDERCKYPAAYTDRAMPLGQGRTAFGMNLDGASGKKAPPNTCPHTNYVSPAGEGGIDNQLYRVLSCISTYRSDVHVGANSIRDYADGARRDGLTTTVFEIRGFKEGGNDYEVEVGLYSSKKSTVYDRNAQGVPYASYRITDDTRWHNVTKGRILDGILTTEPMDVRLDVFRGKDWMRHGEYVVHGARLKVRLLADGTAEGLLAGYSPIDNVFDNETGQVGAVMHYRYSCPALYEALSKMADSRPDPETGRCSDISTAFEIKAIPAFLVHPEGSSQASASPQAATVDKQQPGSQHDEAPDSQVGRNEGR